MSGPSRPFRVVTPEYGPVTALVAFAVVALVVDVATDALRASLAAVAPAVSPALLGGAMAVVLWLVLGLVVFVEGRRQLAANPREFVATDVVLAHLAATRPGRYRLLAAIAATALGAVLVWVALDPFRATLGDLFDLLSVLADPDGGLPIGLLALRWLVVFAVGALALAWGGERVAIGLVREAQYRRWRRRLG